MLKKLQIVSLAILIMVLIVSCAPKPSAGPGPVVKAPTESPAAGETPVEEVAEDISEAGNADEGLDTSELDDVDGILSDIENI